MVGQAAVAYLAADSAGDKMTLRPVVADRVVAVVVVVAAVASVVVAREEGVETCVVHLGLVGRR